MAGIQIVVLTAFGGQARGDEFPEPEREPALQWPAGPSPSAQLDSLVAAQNVLPPQAGVNQLSDPRGDKFSAAAAPRPLPVSGPADADTRPRLNAFWDYGVVLESSDKVFRFHVGGRLDFDNTWYHQSQDLPFLLQDGSDMRRARLRADGSIGDNVDFVTEVNFANIQDVTNEDSTAQIGSVGLTDFYVDFKQVPLVQNLRIGHFHEPMGLENLTSSNCWYYMEQSPGHDAFMQPFNYVTGIETFNTWCDDRLTGAVAFERVGKQDVSPFAFGSGPGKYAVTGRVTCLPLYQDEGRRLLHLGIGYTYGGTEENFYAANRPLVRAGAGSQEVPNVIYTGTFYTPDAVQIADAEIAAVLGRFSLSAEYQRAMGTNLYGQLNNGVFSDPRGNVAYQGFYTEAGFFLNPDDHRYYDKKDATWGRQVTQGESSAAKRILPGSLPTTRPSNFYAAIATSTWPRATQSLRRPQAHRPGGNMILRPDWTGTSIPKSTSSSTMSTRRLDYVNGTGGNINGLGCRMHVNF